MATIIVRESVTGSTTTLEEVDLNMTNDELIQGLIEGGVLKPLKGGPQYLIVGKDNSVSQESKSLAQLGFSDGDTIRIVTKDVGAF